MNIELFLALVKERPVLYDLTNPQYKDRREKDKKWREICTAMDITIEVAKTKWKSLKDCYAKHIKGSKTTTGQAFAKYVHWQWANQMDFMTRHLSFAATTTNLQHANSDVQDTQSSSDVQDTQSSSDVHGTQSSSRRHTQRRRQTYSDSENTLSNTDRIIHYFENKRKSSLDATEIIFMGYAKSIKSFSIKRQARIKMKIAKMIMEEEIAHYEETVLLQFNQSSPNSLSSPVANTSHNTQLYISSPEANTTHNLPSAQVNEVPPNYLLSPVANTSSNSLSPDHNAQSYMPFQEANTTHNSAQVNELPPNYLLSPVANTSRNSLSPDHNAQSYIPSQEANTAHNSPFTQVNEPPPKYLFSPVANTSRNSLSPDHNAQSYIPSQEANTAHNSPFAQVHEPPPKYLLSPVANISHNSFSPDHNYAQSHIPSQEANTTHNISPFVRVNSSQPSPFHNQKRNPENSLKSFFTNFY